MSGLSRLQVKAHADRMLCTLALFSFSAFLFVSLTFPFVISCYFTRYWLSAFICFALMVLAGACPLSEPVSVREGFCFVYFENGWVNTKTSSIEDCWLKR